MRSVGVVTVGRSDYGLYRPLLRRIDVEPDLELRLFVGGMHLSPEFGMTVRQIEQDGFAIAERVGMLESSDTPESIGKSIGRGVIGFADAFARQRPDLLVVLGDRFEMFSAALAALPFQIPIAHIHGGELTEGAIDDALRHSMTKLSHVHLVATEEYAARVRQLGEEPWRIVVSGALGLDNLRDYRKHTTAELEERYGLDLRRPPLLVTMHPATLEYDQTEWQVTELLGALEEIGLPIIFTLPNADTAGRTIARAIEGYVKAHSDARIVDNLGTDAYFSVMSIAAAMVGNSSSGLIEAPSFELPVVNVGNRQRGRIRARNVIDVGNDRSDIRDGIARALAPPFRESLRGLANPYGSGGVAEKIVCALKRLIVDKRLLIKRFQDLAEHGSS